MDKTVAVVLAAGQGKRMNSSVQKQYLLIQDKPVLYYSLKVFQDSFIDEIVLVVGAGETEYCRTEIVEKYGFSKVRHVIEGGKERYHSVYNGLRVIADSSAGESTGADVPEAKALENSKDKVVFIHDGARPFITADILERAYESVKECGACVVGMPVKDTIKIADADGFVAATPNRAQVWQVQTPQVFSFDLVRQAYSLLIKEEKNLLAQGIFVTDDTMVVEYFTKRRAKLVQGTYENIKITTPEDLRIAEAFLE